jgi:hypothetical protein
MKNKLKKYDKFLNFTKKIDGTRMITRQSPFNAARSFDILSVRNMYIGSGLWLFKKIQRMDNQKINIVGEVQDINKKLYRRKDNSNMHKELADFLTESII